MCSVLGYLGIFLKLSIMGFVVLLLIVCLVHKVFTFLRAFINTQMLLCWIYSSCLEYHWCIYLLKLFHYFLVNDEPKLYGKLIIFH